MPYYYYGQVIFSKQHHQYGNGSLQKYKRMNKNIIIKWFFSEWSLFNQSFSVNLLKCNFRGNIYHSQNSKSTLQKGP